MKYSGAKKELKEVLSKWYKKDAIYSIINGRMNISAKNIKEINKEFPKIPLRALINTKEYLKGK